jgi:hypothetical protein
MVSLNDINKELFEAERNLGGSNNNEYTLKYLIEEQKLLLEYLAEKLERR